MTAAWINYALMIQFGVLASAWLWQGDKMQAVYWCGALICTAGVTFK